MKRPSRFPLAAFLVLLPFGLGAQIVLGNGRPETELRSLPAFRSLAFACPGELRVRRGSTQEVRLTVDSNVLPLIRTEVSGGRLEISFKPRSGAIKSKKLLVEVTMPELEAIELAGSGSAFVERFSGPSLAVVLSGSGKLEAKLEYRSLELLSSGSGDLELAGSADQARLRLTGSGSLAAELSGSSLDLESSGSGRVELSGRAEEASFSLAGSGSLAAFPYATRRARLSITGSGGAELSVAEALDVTMRGSGSASYRGSPRVESSISGSGRLRRAGD